jgi:hypothetical protein
MTEEDEDGQRAEGQRLNGEAVGRPNLRGMQSQEGTRTRRRGAA